MASAAPAWSQDVGGSSYQLNLALSRLATNPADAEALVAAGEAALALGDNEAAQDFLTRADGLWPRNPRIKAGLAAAMVRNSNALEALRLFTEAERAGLNVAGLAGERGLAYDLVGVAGEAQRYYRQALSAAPSDEISRRLAISLAIAGDRQQFEAVLLPQLQRQVSAAFRVRAFGLAILGSQQEAVTLANRMMPPALAQQMGPYLRTMRRLTPAQQAAAAHFGNFPRAADIGRDDPRVTAFAALYRRTPAVTAAAPIARATPGRSAKRASNQRQRRAEREKHPERRPGSARSARQVAAASTSAPRTPGRPAAAQAAPPPPSSPPAPRLPLPAQPVAPIAEASLHPPVVTTMQAVAAPPPLVTAMQPLASPPAAALAPQAPPPALALSAPAPAIAMPGPSPGTAVPALAIHAAPPAPAMQQPPPALPNGVIFGPPMVMPDPFAGPPVPPVAAQATSHPPLASVPTPDLGQPSLGAEGMAPLATPTPPATTALAPFPASAAPLGTGAAPAMLVPPVALPPITPPVAAPATSSSSGAGMASGFTAAFSTFAPAEGEGPPLPTRVPPGPPAQPPSTAAQRPAPSMPPVQPRQVAVAQPSRTWVQVGTGRDRQALAYDWSRLAGRAPELLKDRRPWLMPWGQASRLLVGPFAGTGAAQAFLNRLLAKGVEAVLWTSPGGQPVELLRSR